MTDIIPANPLEQELRKYLEAWNIVDAEKTVNRPDYTDWLTLNGWELVPMVASFLTEELELECPQLSHCCEAILSTVAEKGKAKEILVALLEQCEAFTPNVRFRSCLPAMSICLKNVPESSKRLSCDWVFTTLVGNLHSHQVPENPKLEGKERFTFEEIPKVIEMTKALDSLTSFYEPLLADLNSSEANDVIQRKRDFKLFLLQTLGNPYAFLNLHVEPDTEVIPEARRSCSRIIEAITSLVTNMKHVFTVEEDRSREGTPRSALDDSLVATAIPPLAVPTFFYMVYAEGVCFTSMPQCYHPAHILSLTVPLANALVESKREFAVHKGLLLVQAVIERVPKSSLHDYTLDDPNHHQLLRSLFEVSIYHELREFRQLAFQCFQNYQSRFREDALYRFYLTALQLSNHSGIIGYTITQIKDSVLRSLTTGDLHFQGTKLRMLIDQFCRLSHGAETDLLEVSDEVMSTLNLLYCVLKRDTKNATGIWDYKDKIKETYLAPLEEGIKLARAHYELKLKDSNKPKKDEIVELTVGGQQLPHMPPEKMKEIVRAALTTFDLLESTLCRVTDIL